MLCDKHQVYSAKPHMGTQMFQTQLHLFFKKILSKKLICFGDFVGSPSTIEYCIYDRSNDSLGENTENDGADRLLLADKLSSFRTP